MSSTPAHPPGHLSRWRAEPMGPHARTLVFDLDGTLVDTLPDLMGALNETLRGAGYRRIAATQVLHCLHDGLPAMLEGALAAAGDGAAPPDRIALLADEYMNRYAGRLTRESRAYPGVTAALEWHVRRGARLAVCSNKTEALATRLLDELGLGRFFRAVVGADTCAERKPSPMPLLHAISIAGGTAADAALIGDSRVDLECARAAGVHCLLFAGGYGRLAANEPGAGAVFDDWTALHGSRLLDAVAQAGCAPGRLAAQSLNKV